MNYKIKELKDDLRPRERMKKYGVSNLSDAELLSIILRCGIKNKNVLDLSMELLNEYDGLSNLANVKLNTLSKTKGIKETKAITILAAIELGKRSLKTSKKNIKILDGLSVYNLMKYDFMNYYQEKFIVILLDTKKNLISKETLFIGTLSSSTVHPREIFKSAILSSASSIIVVHNHPTGDPTPSKEDISLTNSLKESGKTIGIPLVDHVIIGINRFYSFYEGRIITIDEE